MDIDLSTLPTGRRGWTDLVEYAKSNDDRVERSFLELKSDVDLNTKEGRIKVAKFILGAANRDPAEAAHRFGGHAVMLLGVSTGSASGIAAFEAKDLARDITKFVGVDGPKWDYNLLDGEDVGKSVVVLTVAPPTGEMFPCMATSGTLLEDGHFYLRADGETREATGAEVRAMLARRPVPTISTPEVQVVGKVVALRVDLAIVATYVQRTAASLRRHLDPAQDVSHARYIVSSAFMTDTRSEDRYRQDIDRWETDTERSLGQPIARLASFVFPGLQLAVANGSNRFRNDLRVEVEFDPPVIAVDRQRASEESPDHRDVFEGQPRPWGEETIAMSIGHYSPLASLANSDGSLEVGSQQPPKVAMELSRLRPATTHTTDADEWLLVLVTEDEDPPPTVTGHWRLTHREHDGVFEGSLEMPVTLVDWRAPLANWLGVEQQCTRSGVRHAKTSRSGATSSSSDTELSR